MQLVFCKQCLKSLQVSLKEAAQTVWASVELVVHPKGFCKECGHMDEQKTLLSFCSPKCLEEFVAQCKLTQCVSELRDAKVE